MVASVDSLMPVEGGDALELEAAYVALKFGRVFSTLVRLPTMLQFDKGQWLCPLVRFIIMGQFARA